jgi:hypothetical protein
LDRTCILDFIARHRRGCDRHDLICAARLPRGWSGRAWQAINPGPEYGNWANATHAATSQAHTHNITTHTCEIDCETAHAENYLIVVLLRRDRRSAQFISGRYLDRLSSMTKAM